MWGLIDAGANWWNFIHHESSSGFPPPNRLTISSQSPGELLISSGGDILFTLRDGSLVCPSTDVLWAGVVANFLLPSREALYHDAVKALGTKNGMKKATIMIIRSACTFLASCVSYLASERRTTVEHSFSFRTNFNIATHGLQTESRSNTHAITTTLGTC